MDKNGAHNAKAEEAAQLSIHRIRTPYSKRLYDFLCQPVLSPSTYRHQISSSLSLPPPHSTIGYEKPKRIMFPTTDVFKPLRFKSRAKKSRAKLEQPNLQISLPLASYSLQDIQGSYQMQPLSSSGYSRHRYEPITVHPSPRASKPRIASTPNSPSHIDVDITLFSTFGSQTTFTTVSVADQPFRPSMPLPPTGSALRPWRPRPRQRRHDQGQTSPRPLMCEPQVESTRSSLQHQQLSPSRERRQQQQQLRARRIAVQTRACPSRSLSISAETEVDSDEEDQHQPRAITAWEMVGERRDREKAAGRGISGSRVGTKAHCWGEAAMS